MDRQRVLVKERIADHGVQLLAERFSVDVGLDMAERELFEQIGGYDALIVRSATQVSAHLIEQARRLKVIGRAGTGVDNVDVAAATRRGIVVANAPGSNMVAAAEHTIGLLLAVARQIPQADAALRAGRWERHNGVELADKTLGIIGFGRIGQLVGWRARALGMRVLVHDPFVSEERCRELQVTAVTLDELWQSAEFITLHVPLTAETENLISRDTLSRMRPGVRLVNAARGGLVDADALVEALRDGRVAGAGLDVFPTEPYTEGPLLELPNVVATPHLGASTLEAQDRAGVIVAEQVAAALEGRFVSNAVNIPQLGAEDMEVLTAYLPLAGRLGALASGLCDRGGPIDVVYSGGLAQFDTRLLTAAVLAGAFAGQSDEPINIVNARAIAEARGMAVSEAASQAAGEYTNLITVRCGGSEVAGTTIGSENHPWLVGVYGVKLEIEFAAHMLVMQNDDLPGVIGRVGTMLGEEHVNIANMNVSRGVDGNGAVMVLSLDHTPQPQAIERLSRLDGIHSVRLVDVEV